VDEISGTVRVHEGCKDGKLVFFFGKKLEETSWKAKV
jgi:hypothetical protein